MEFFSSNEDELNFLINKLTKTISEFTTLSRELAEKAIIETNMKIKEGESIIEKMNNFINNNDNNINKEDIIELNKKLNNYKNEFSNLANTFDITQKKYINKKAENALIYESNMSNKKNDLIDDDESKKNIEENKNYDKNKLKIEVKERKNSINNENNLVFQKNIGDISKVENGENNINIPDEVFNSINNKANKKRKKIFCGILIILSIVFISVILFLTFFFEKNQ